MIFQDLVNRARPTEVTWHDADTWRGHASPHGCLRGVNSDIGWSGLNRAIGRLKSHGVESASWATIPPITRDLTAEITRSEIRVTSHQFRAIRRLKSHGVKSVSWATIHQFRTNLSINRPHHQCKIDPLVSPLMEVGHWDQRC